MQRILVGTSGWSYPDWVGPFYPKALSQGGWLSFYADRFPAIEVNASHYHFPTRERVEGAAERMARTAVTHVVYKAPREITHEHVPAGELDLALHEASRFLDALAPMRDRERLAGTLFQFSHAVGPEDLLPGLEAILEAQPPEPLYVEVRHAAFNEERHYDRLLAAVTSTGGTVVATDSPAATITRAPPAERAYFRLHGRNEATWFLKDPPGPHGAARYDYRYTPEEIERLAERVRGAQEAEEVLVFFNNHLGGSAPANATELMDQLGLAPPRSRATLDDFA